LMQASAALNLAVYLLFKTENAETSGDSIDPTIIQNHPVMHYLQKLNALIQSMEDGVETKVGDLTDQLEKLVQAAKLIDGSTGESDDESNNDEESDELLENAESVKNGSEINDDPIVATVPDIVSGDASSEDVRAIHRNVLTEARFGLRPNELYSMKKTSTKRPRHQHLVIADAGDDDDDVGSGQQKSVVQSLSVTLNSIEQRSDSKKKKVAPLVEHLDDHVEDDGELRRGLEMMEAELGKASDEDVEERGEDPELDDYDDDGFYAKVSKRSGQRKSDRKDIYCVAPKFPRVEGEIDGERAISKMILKNRGLVAHKAKINRNPRVKKREQFRKAIVRRKGAVRDVRTNEGHKYGGEETGIKSGLSRSRKLGR
jgi:U3 small nucleolar RNA-associated protein 3